MDNSAFTLLRQPHVIFGPGKVRLLPDLIAGYGRNVLVVTGVSTLEQSGVLGKLFEQLHSRSLQYGHLTVSREPHPELVDRAVSRYRESGIDVVVAIGGGSVIDAGKSVSAMLLKTDSIERYIEGLDGCIQHDGRKVPFIALPTTSGTGSEATNNAVISKVGVDGYKRSLRHPEFVPEIALVDPELMLGAPAGLTAASGMDAGTQLIEAFVSPGSCRFTDVVAWSGLEHFNRSFLRACTDGSGDIEVRSAMAYAALMSGIALANAGLGIVHGFASSVGGYCDIAHGVLCATLLASATKENILQLRQTGDNPEALIKYAAIGRLFSGCENLSQDGACDALVDTLLSWQEQLDFPRLSSYGLRSSDLESIASRTRSKNNAVELHRDQYMSILRARL